MFVGGTLIVATFYNLLIPDRPGDLGWAEVWLNAAVVAALALASVLMALRGAALQMPIWVFTVGVCVAFILGSALINLASGGPAYRTLLWLPWLAIVHVQIADMLNPRQAGLASGFVFVLGLGVLWGYPEIRALPFGMPEFDIIAIMLLLQLTLIGMLYNTALRREAQFAARASAESERDAAKVRAEMEGELFAARLELAYINRSLTISALAASIAHEIKQPLSAIITSGHASIRWLARDVPAVAEAQDCNERIVRDASRASEIVISMRDMLKRGESVRAPIHPRRVVDDILPIMRDEAHSRGAHITVSYGEDLPEIEVDRVQMQQVIINLVLNAIDASQNRASGDRPIAIDVAVARDGVTFSVEDRGAGMTPAEAAHLFEAFYTTKPGGMGLGLAICRTIALAHGGAIDAEPLAVGMKFTMAIKSADAQRAAKPVSGNAMPS